MDTEETRRSLLGGIIKREIGRRWRNQTIAENDMHVSHATLHRVTTGVHVSDVVLVKVEKGLDLPRDLLQHFIAGDVDEIAALPFDSASPGWDADLQRVMLKALNSEVSNRDQIEARQSAT